jgi:hypothetical protein
MGCYFGTSRQVWPASLILRLDERDVRSILHRGALPQETPMAITTRTGGAAVHWHLVTSGN